MNEELAGMTVKLAMDNGSFNEGIQALNRQMKVIDSEFKAVASNVEGFGDALDELKLNADRLNQSINVQSEIVSKYQQRLENGKKTLENNVEAHSRLEKELKSAQLAYEQSAASLGKNADKTIQFAKEVERLKKELTDNEQKIRNSQKSIDNQTVSVNKAQQKLNEYSKELNQVNQKLNEASNQAKMSSSVFNEFKTAIAQNVSETKILGVSLSDLLSGMSSSNAMAGVLGGVVSGLTTAFIGLATQGISKAIDMLKEFAKEGIKTASDIQESANVIDVVFQDDDVTKWAETVASSFNLAQDEAMEFASTFGAVMSPTNLPTQTIEDMSIVLTQLSGDLSSLWNTSTEESFNALRSAITGEMEPMKQFGVVMSEANLNAYAMAEGIRKTTNEMTEAEKAVLRYNFILENTKIAHGDVARSSDSFANAQRQLQLTAKDTGRMFGEEMLPSLTYFTNSMTDFVEDNQAFISLLGNLGNGLMATFNVLVDIGKIAIEPFVWGIDLISRSLNGCIDTIEIFIDEGKDVLSELGFNFEDTTEDMGYYMQDFAELSQEAMEETAKSTEDAFKDSADAIKGELDIIGDALKEYYDDELKEYEKYLEKKNGTSKEGRKKTALELEEMRKTYENQYIKEMAIEEEKQNKKLKNLKEQEEAYRKQTKVVEEEAEKQKSIWDKVLDSFNKAFEGFSVGGKTLDGNGNLKSTRGFATGTQYAPAGYAIVGEQGRELIQFSGGEKVINHNQTEQILNNSSTTNSNPVVIQHLEVKTDNAEDLLDQILMLLKRGAYA